MNAYDKINNTYKENPEDWLEKCLVLWKDPCKNMCYKILWDNHKTDNIWEDVYSEVCV